MKCLKGGQKFPFTEVDGKYHKSAASLHAKHKQNVTQLNLHAGGDSLKWY